MALTLTQSELDGADLIVVVDETGNYKWSATRSRVEVINMLHDIADAIEAGEPS